MVDLRKCSRRLKGTRVLTIGNLSFGFASFFALNGGNGNDTLFYFIVSAQCYTGTLCNEARSGWQTIAVLLIGVAASQRLGAAVGIGVAAVSVVADFALDGTIIFINAVRMLLGSGLVVVVVVVVSVIRMGVVMVMSMAVSVVGMSMIVSVISVLVAKTVIMRTRSVFVVCS